MTLHAYKFSLSTLHAWLKANSTALSPEAEHLFLENIGKSTDASTFKELLSYFESAHLDAREYFHQLLRIDLHPLSANQQSPVLDYPRSLPKKTIKGFFGEVLCGLVAEHFLKSKTGPWIVPVFLFRNHQAAEYYLVNLQNKISNMATECIGRHGDDFLAVELDNNGALAGVLVGEVKYRQTLRATGCVQILDGHTVKKKKKSIVMEGVCTKLSNQGDVPQDLHRLLMILQNHGSGQHENLIKSIDALLRKQGSSARKLSRTDMILIIYEETGKNKKPPHIQSKPVTYTASRFLHTIEMHITDAEELISKTYSEIYK